MNAKDIYRNLVRLALVALVPVFPLSCEKIKDDMDGCGIYIEFVYDYNMEYADAFDSQVKTVDVFIFDNQGRYLLTRHAQQEELVNGKRMFLDNMLDVGQYKILTVGDLSDDFRVSDGNSGELVPGQTTLEDVCIALNRESAIVARQFSPLWVGKAIDIDNRADLTVWPVYLMKYTNRFDLILADINGEATTLTDEAAYTFEIVTPEGAVYGGIDNAPRVNETVTYTPWILAPGTEQGELSVGQINTDRLIYGAEYPYLLVVRDVQSGEELWRYDLMLLLQQTKPDTRPDGTPLPMQEYLDRRSEWHLVVLYKEGGLSGNDVGFVAVAIKINGWIIWLNDIGV